LTRRLALGAAVLLTVACRTGAGPSPSVGPPVDPAPERAAASARWGAAVAADGGDVRAHLRWVSAMQAEGRRSEARRIYEERAAAPGAREVDRVMAARLATTGASTPLRDVYAAAAERDAGNPWWPLGMAEVDVGEADAWNQRRIDAIDRGDRLTERRALAQARSALRRAERALDRATLLAPDLAETHLYRGFLRAAEGDLHEGSSARAAAYRAAQVAFEAAVGRDPSLVLGWAALGDVRYRTGDERGAFHAWHEGARRAPDDPHLREALGVSLHQLGHHTEAAEHFSAQALLEPESATPWLRLGDVWADDERWDDALAAYDEALRRDAAAADAHYKAGMVLEHRGRTAEARLAYERHVAAGGQHAEAARRRIERLLRECAR
jgi:tetratricopeptide (TPR) repeat protein